MDLAVSSAAGRLDGATAIVAGTVEAAGIKGGVVSFTLPAYIVLDVVGAGARSGDAALGTASTLAVVGEFGSPAHIEEEISAVAVLEASISVTAVFGSSIVGSALMGIDTLVTAHMAPSVDAVAVRESEISVTTTIENVA